MRYGKVVMISFYFALSAAKSNNSVLLTASVDFPSPAGYCAQAVVSEATASNVVGAIGIYRRDEENKIKCSGQLPAGNYHIAQFCYVTSEQRKSVSQITDTTDNGGRIAIPIDISKVTAVYVESTSYCCYTRWTNEGKTLVYIFDHFSHDLARNTSVTVHYRYKSS